MSPESGNRFRAKDMRENKELKRNKRICKIALCFGVLFSSLVTGKPQLGQCCGSLTTHL